MEFSVKTSEILPKLKMAADAAEKKSTIPILAFLLLEARDGRVFITATNLELSVQTSCEAKVKKEGSSTIAANKLLNLVLLLPDTEIRFKLLENHWMQISSDQKTYKLVGRESKNFPTLLKVLEAPSVLTTIQASDICEITKKVTFAISQEKSRYTIDGALLRMNGAMSMVATDGHRLAMASRAAESSTLPDVIVHKNALLLVGKWAKELPEGAKIGFAQVESHLFFVSGEWKIISRKLDGKFPNYEAVVPKDNSIEATVNREEFQSALRRVSQMADSRSYAVRLVLNGTEMEVSATSPEHGEAKETVAVISGQEYTKAFEIGFNASYLLDFLGHVESENVALAFKDNQSAGEMRPAGDASYRYVVMPLRV